MFITYKTSFRDVKIIDTEFEISYSHHPNDEFVIYEIIRCYAERNLNVPKNLLLFFKEAASKIGWTTERMAKWHMENCSLYKELYHQELSKYFLWI